MTLRLAFMGTPEFAKSSLQALIDAGHRVDCVYSQPPRRAGRGRKSRPSPVQALAEQNQLMVRVPESFESAADQNDFCALEIDAAVVVAYGLRLPQRILNAPQFGCVNAHASLLPRWRGAAPIERAILAGDSETGVTIMQMDEDLDTGPILMQEPLMIGSDDDAGSLREQLSVLAADLIVRALERVELGSMTSIAQHQVGVTYARKLDVSEGRLDWHKRADELARLVRGFGPRPGAWFEHDGTRIRVLKAAVASGNGSPGAVVDDALTVACGEATLRLGRLQRPGKVAMDAAEFMRGYALPRGTVLS